MKTILKAAKPALIGMMIAAVGAMGCATGGKGYRRVAGGGQKYPAVQAIEAIASMTKGNNVEAVTKAVESVLLGGGGTIGALSWAQSQAMATTISKQLTNKGTPLEQKMNDLGVVFNIKGANEYTSLRNQVASYANLSQDVGATDGQGYAAIVTDEELKKEIGSIQDKEIRLTEMTALDSINALRNDQQSYANMKALIMMATSISKKTRLKMIGDLKCIKTGNLSDADAIANFLAIVTAIETHADKIKSYVELAKAWDEASIAQIGRSTRSSQTAACEGTLPQELVRVPASTPTN